MTTAAPPQRLDALRLANDIRVSAAAWRREIQGLPRREGLTRLAETLEARTTERHIGSLRLEHFLTSVRRAGPQSAREWTLIAGLIRHPRSVRVRGLTLRERSALAAHLRYRAERSRS